MDWHKFSLVGTELWALPAGALWCPSAKLLCISDLHLGKSERIARRGGALIPPYDSQETLIRLAQLVENFDPDTMVCLGDSFDDCAAQASLPPELSQMLVTMMAGRTWIWIAGNHDPGPVELGGTWQREFGAAGLTFRHIALDGADAGEVSGHYHPKAGPNGQRRRPCFCYDARRLLLPAFGTYTGGLSVRDTAITSLFSSDALAVMIGTKSTVLPMRAA